MCCDWLGTRIISYHAFCLLAGSLCQFRLLILRALACACALALHQLE